MRIPSFPGRVKAPPKSRAAKRWAMASTSSGPGGSRITTTSGGSGWRAFVPVLGAHGRCRAGRCARSGGFGPGRSRFAFGASAWSARVWAAQTSVGWGILVMRGTLSTRPLETPSCPRAIGARPLRPALGGLRAKCLVSPAAALRHAPEPMPCLPQPPEAPYLPALPYLARTPALHVGRAGRRALEASRRRALPGAVDAPFPCGSAALGVLAGVSDGGGEKPPYLPKHGHRGRHVPQGGPRPRSFLEAPRFEALSGRVQAPASGAGEDNFAKKVALDTPDGPQRSRGGTRRARPPRRQRRARATSSTSSTAAAHTRARPARRARRLRAASMTCVRPRRRARPDRRPGGIVRRGARRGRARGGWRQQAEVVEHRLGEAQR
jgi:hypothetical protein